jgi:citronellol/citronellal dehydrogenase
MQQGPVALVTGGSRGIGQAICVDLAHHGFDVVPTARSVTKSVEQWGGTVNETAERVRALGREALPLALDLEDLNSVRSVVDATLEHFGRVDVLVNNATRIDFSEGGTFISMFIDTRWEALEKHLIVNITAPLLMMRLLMPVMYEQGAGMVINITQNCDFLALPDLPLPGQGMPGMVVPVSRGATERLAPALRREAGVHGVSVITLDPGLTLSFSSDRFEATAEVGFVPEMAHSVCVPARATTYLATCENPLHFSGTFVVAADLVRQCGLLSEDQIYPPWKDGPQRPESLPRIAGL